MTDRQWVDITRLGSLYQEQMTVDGGIQQYRHRRILVSNTDPDWHPGKAPHDPLERKASPFDRKAS